MVPKFEDNLMCSFCISRTKFKVYYLSVRNSGTTINVCVGVFGTRTTSGIKNVYHGCVGYTNKGISIFKVKVCFRGGICFKRHFPFIYDNSLALLAFLARGEEDDLRRAKILADTFVDSLEKDRTYGDSRLRNAYMSGDLTDPVPGTAKLPGWWDIQRQQWYDDNFSVGTHTGNMAWAMLALIAYYEQQGGDKYLEAAKAMGEWVEAETRDQVGAGYTGGYEGLELTETNTVPPEKLTYKAVDFNISLGRDVESVFHVTLYNDCTQSAHISC